MVSGLSPVIAPERSVRSSLPQPPPALLQRDDLYEYVTYDALETEWLGDPRRLRSFLANNGEAVDATVRYAPGTLVWVLLSKGKPKQATSAQSGYQASALHKKKRNKKNGRRSDDQRQNSNENQASRENDGPEIAAADGNSNMTTQKDDTNAPEIIATADGNMTTQKNDAKDDTNTDTNHEETTLNKSRKEFFLRARVVADDEELSPGGAAQLSTRTRASRRILVRYSKGATYRVRAYNLVPVLEEHSVHNGGASSAPVPQSNGQEQAPQTTALPPLVVLVPETNIYRRMVKVHTTPEDSFVEIGCDYGITVDKVRSSMEEAGDVPKVWPMEESAGSSASGKKAQDRVPCLGVDKSKESVDMARQRFPRCKFLRGNILDPEGMASLRVSCEWLLAGAAPSVVGIDINGNRDVEDVLECLQLMMDEAWARRPRLIIVKSRFLYWEVKELAPTGTEHSSRAG